MLHLGLNLIFKSSGRATAAEVEGTTDGMDVAIAEYGVRGVSGTEELGVSISEADREGIVEII